MVGRGKRKRRIILPGKRRKWYKTPATTAAYAIKLLKNSNTCALSPDGNAGFVTSSRIGRIRSAIDCFRGRGRLNTYFIGSVITTQRRLRYDSHPARFSTLIDLNSTRYECEREERREWWGKGGSAFRKEESGLLYNTPWMEKMSFYRWEEKTRTNSWIDRLHRRSFWKSHNLSEDQ